MGNNQTDFCRLGMFYNVHSGQLKKVVAEEYIKDNYPSIWDELETIGLNGTREDNAIFKIDQRIPA